ARFGSPFVRLRPEQVETLLGDISRYETAAPAPAAAPGGPIRSEPTQEKTPLVRDLYGDAAPLDGARRPPLEAFFAATKRATLHGYDTSEIGLHQELRYKGNKILLEFRGCDTQEGHECPRCGQKPEA